MQDTHRVAQIGLKKKKVRNKGWQLFFLST